jgi:putative ABC transport system permease protein
MTRLLHRLLGRLPIGWLQLTHNRTRLVAAMAGVAFANILVFVQLGMLGALQGTVGATYSLMQAEILISSSDANTLTDGSPLTRRVMFQVLAEPGVAAAAPLYLGQMDWTRPDGSKATLTVYGLPPEAESFAGPTLGSGFRQLAVADRVLLDLRTRGVDPESLADVSLDHPLRFEANGVALTAVDTFELGGGFSADGAMITSDQTFLRLFGQRLAGTPTHILIRVAEGQEPAFVATGLREALGNAPVLVRTLEEAASADLAYQTTQRPVGVIFGMGVLIGMLVGLVIVYQVLATDVADHLREYATFKAMGYPHRFFLSLVFEEALILAVLGFLPGVMLSLGIYATIAAKTGLPVDMTALRAAAVFAGTILACGFSGAIATQRLRSADPAELF